MTETEKRRVELLTQTRTLYHDKNAIPAVHPRYSATYHNLYKENTIENETNYSLRIRLIIALLIFVIFAGIDYKDLYIFNYQSEQITSVISQNVIIENIDIEN